MTAWIAWSLLTSALVAIAAAALERVAAYTGVPRRFVVIMGITAITAAPLTFALRVAPSRPAPPSALAVTIPRATAPFMEGGSVPASVSGRPIVRTSGASALPVAPTREPNTTWARMTSRVAAARWLALGPSVDRWVARAWIAASTVLLIVFMRALVGLARRQSRWDNEETEIGRVFVSRDDGPAVVGFARPRVVLPSWALAAEGSTRAMLLQHEAEHIRAGDTRVLMAAELSLVAFPWNAVLWWLVDRLRLAIEIDCDARVVRATGDALAYGSVLLAVGERYAAAIPFAAPLTEPRSNLDARISAMTTPPPGRPVLSSFPLVAIAVGVMTTAAWAPRPAPLLRARAERVAATSTVPGIAFVIEGGRSSFDPFTGTLVFAAQRGRLDIVARERDAPVYVINGNPIAPPLADVGEYYLFDSTGFILVRPARKTFSTFALKDVSYNYHDDRDGWPAFFEFSPEVSSVFLPREAVAEQLMQHAEIHVYWNLDARPSPSGPSLARGRLTVADAPPSEGGVARWFGAAQALAGLPALPPANGVRITVVGSSLRPKGDTRGPANFGAVHQLSSLRPIDVDPSRLVLPGDFVETPWPGFEHATNAPALSRDGGARWRLLAMTIKPRGRDRF